MKNSSASVSPFIFLIVPVIMFLLFSVMMKNDNQRDIDTLSGPVAKTNSIINVSESVFTQLLLK